MFFIKMSIAQKIIAALSIIAVLVVLLNFVTGSRNPSSPSLAPTGVLPQPTGSAPSGTTSPEGKNLPQQPTQVPVQKPHYQYQLAPELLNRGFDGLIRSVFASSVCKAENLGSTASVYLLENHVSPQDAQKHAAQFGIVSAPYGISRGNDVFQYVFTDSYRTGIYSMITASGMSSFSKIGPTGEAVKSAALAKGNVTDALSSYKLNNGLTMDQMTATDEGFHFVYSKSWADFPMVDMNSLQKSFAVDMCNLPSAEVANKIHILTKPDNTIEQITDYTRMVKKTISADTLTLQDSLAANMARPLAEPLISPANGAMTGTVTIQEATIAYVDYGAGNAQGAYAPVYITRGTVNGATTKVITLFPAVKTAEVSLWEEAVQSEKSGKKIEGVDSSQSQESFELQTLSPPPEVPDLNSVDYDLSQTDEQDFVFDGPEKLESPYSEAEGACISRTVNYSVSCQVRGTAICNGTVTMPESADPNNLCENGCIAKEKKISTEAGKDACKEYLNGMGVPTNGYVPYSSYSSDTSDEVTCNLLACPL